MLTINSADVAVISRVLRKHAKEYEEKAERAHFIKDFYEAESDQCYRLAREFNDVLDDQAKRIAVTYED